MFVMGENKITEKESEKIQDKINLLFLNRRCGIARLLWI